MKKTLLIESHVKLSLLNSNLFISKESSKNSKAKDRTIPLSDIEIIIMESLQINITTGLLNALLKKKIMVVVCDNKNMPQGILTPLIGNVTQTERHNRQLSASLPLKKQMWRHIIKCKITNQAKVLAYYSESKTECMYKWVQEVKSGDRTSMEARAAQYYWSHLFKSHIKHFKRERNGLPPNNILNYGYSVIRLTIIKNLITTGLLSSVGLHHSNKYNPFCLADDIMEPYRPFIDNLVCKMILEGADISTLNNDIKNKLFNVLTTKVKIGGRATTIGNAIKLTIYSLLKSFKDGKMQLQYPEINI